MTSRLARTLPVWLAAAGVVLTHGAALAANLSVCIDTSSPSAARDEKLAEAVAHREGADLAVARFDGNADDDGFSAKKFSKLISTRCKLVLGYPVDAAAPAAPPNLMLTKPYDHTGFVLVVPEGSAARSLSDLPSGTEVAVTYETAPNLYFLNHKNVSPDVHESDGETLKALTSGAVKAAMAWGPTVDHYLASTPNAPHLKTYPLDEPHALFNVVALYGPDGAADAARFQTEVAALETAAPGGEGAGGGTAVTPDAAPAAPASGGALPALYTSAQAQAGAAKYIGNCQVCHGNKLQGRVGPALKGPNFASEKSAFSVSDVFTIVAHNMPASQPGTLPQDDYVDIMAFLLQQNGYPAGQTALTFDNATASKVPLRFHG